MYQLTVPPSFSMESIDLPVSRSACGRASPTDGLSCMNPLTGSSSPYPVDPEGDSTLRLIASATGGLSWKTPAALRTVAHRRGAGTRHVSCECGAASRAHTGTLNCASRLPSTSSPNCRSTYGRLPPIWRRVASTPAVKRSRQRCELCRLQGNAKEIPNAPP